MTEVDLIPSDYRLKCWFGRALKKLGIAFTVLVLCTLLAFVTVRQGLQRVTGEVEALQSQQAISTRQRDELARLNETRTRYQRQLELLQGLRSGAAAVSMFETIDRSLSGNDVWFLNWEFRRAGHLVSEKEQTVNTGYFIVLPADKGKKNKEAWRIETHMSIKGQARDHSALSQFVQRLLLQAEIQDVHVLNTDLRRVDDTPVVEFDLAVIVNTRAVAS